MKETNTVEGVERDAREVVAAPCDTYVFKYTYARDYGPWICL